MKKSILLCLLVLLFTVPGCRMFKGYQYEELIEKLEVVVLVNFENKYINGNLVYTEIQTISDKELVLQFAEDLCQSKINNILLGAPSYHSGKGVKLLYSDGSYDLLGQEFTFFYDADENRKSGYNYDGLSSKALNKLFEEYLVE